MGTHPSTHHPSIKTRALFAESLVEKNSNMVFNKVLTIVLFPIANPNNVYKGFSLLLLCT
jgi:hypothetical protein